jgi:hypothetical protein
MYIMKVVVLPSEKVLHGLDVSRYGRHSIYYMWRRWVAMFLVSRDWGRLQMGSLNRSEFCMIPLEVYFYFKIHFKLELFQNGVRPGAL